jgi:hypothetical protein
VRNEGEKLRGIAVDTGGRGTASTESDENLVSNTVKDLVAGGVRGWIACQGGGRSAPRPPLGSSLTQ